MGYWLPRKTKTVDRSIIYNKHRLQYWISVGAQPTEKVRKLLEKIDFLPKKPAPYGDKYLYEKPAKERPLDFYHKHRWNLVKPDNSEFYLHKIEEMRKIIERRQAIDSEVLDEYLNNKIE